MRRERHTKFHSLCARLEQIQCSAGHRHNAFIAGTPVGTAENVEEQVQDTRAAAVPWIPCTSVACDSTLTGLNEGQTTHSRHQSSMAKAACGKNPTPMRRNTQLTSGSREMDCFCENTAHSSAQEATTSRLVPSQFSFSFFLI